MQEGNPEAPRASAPRFATRTELFAWLEREGLSHVARLGLEAAAPMLDPSLWPALQAIPKRRLVEALSEESFARTVAWLPPSELRDALPEAVAALLVEEQREAAVARAAVAAKILPPEEPRGLELHRRLCVLRESIPPAVAPRLITDSDRKALRIDERLPGFRFRDLRFYESRLRAGGGFVRPDVKLTLTGGALRGECTCGSTDCVHVLATIDLALDWLRLPPTKTSLVLLDKLSRPAWERTLLALDTALTQGAETRGGFELTWRLRIDELQGIEVTPWVCKLDKKGQKSPPVRVALRRLRLEHGSRLSAEDARVVSLLSDDEEPASRALLDALVLHPRVVSTEHPERTVVVERAVLGLVAEERQGSVRVTAGIDGAALPPAMVERARRARSYEVLFLWDGRRLTLLDVKPEVRDMLDILAREGNVFPRESQPALLQTLAKCATRMPVSMPRSVMGETLPSEHAPVLRLATQADGGIEVEIRIRPLPDAAALAPGEGARDVHVRRGDKAFHAIRDLAQEVLVAKVIAAELPFAGAEVIERFHFHFPDAQGVLDLLRSCEKREPPPELEWVGPQLLDLGNRGPAALRVTLDERQEWFGALGGLTVGGERVTLARLLDSARRKERFLRVAAYSYVELDATLRAHLERLSDHVHEGPKGPLLGPSAAVTLHDLETAGATLEAGTTFRDLVLRITQAENWDPPIPSTLRADLRPYQTEGFRWLSRLASWGAGAILADDMGLGKTVQALALLLSRAEKGPALVVAPTSVAFNWHDEAARFAPSLRLILYADVADRDDTISLLGAGDVLVVSYGLLVRDADKLAKRPFSTIVFDEAQNLKNAATRRSRAARSLVGEFRVALSGTPIENHLGELWSLFAITFPELLGGWTAFRKRYANPIEKKLDPTAAPALARVLAPFLLRRTKSQVESELPPRTDVRVPVVLSAAEWELYEDARLATLSDLETRSSELKKQERHVDVLAALTRLRLLASHPRLYDPRSDLSSSKLARLMELIAELGAEGQRSLVFSQFTSHLRLLRDALEASHVEYVYLDGSTPQGERKHRVRAFQEGTAPLFLLSLKAAGVGLNLTAATNVILLDPWWNPAVEDQASDRAHRPGQTRPVTVYRMVALGTIEEKMLLLHESKRALVARVLEGEEQLAKLSTDELVALLAPSETAQRQSNRW